MDLKALGKDVFDAQCLQWSEKEAGSYVVQGTESPKVDRSVVT